MSESKQTRGVDRAQPPQVLPNQVESAELGADDLYVSQASIDARVAQSRDFEPQTGAFAADIDQVAARGFDGPSSELPNRGSLEAAFGTSLDHVQFYTGASASAACDALQAEAYCVGNQIAVRPGVSDFTVAHEVAHTFQQTGNVQRRATVGAVGDDWEQQADRAAAAAVSGQSVDVSALTRAPATIQRNPLTRTVPAPGAAPGTISYSPGPTTGLNRGLFPRNVPNVSFNLGDDLYDAVVATARFPPRVCDPSWYGWGQLRQFCDQNNWERNLSITQTKQLEASAANVSASFTITVRPRVTDVAWVGEGMTGTIGSSGQTGGSTTSTITQTVGGQASGGGTGTNAPGGVGGSATGTGTVSGSTSTAVAGGTTSGGGTSGSVTSPTQRFTANVAFDITVSAEYGSSGWTWAVVLVGGIGSEIGAEIAEPGTRTGSSSAIPVRFDLATADCIPSQVQGPIPAPPPPPLAGSPALGGASARAKELQGRREQSTSERERAGLGREMERTLTRQRAELEEVVRQRHPTLVAVNASRNLYKVTYDEREYFGTLEVLLDFTPPSASTLALSDTLTTQSGTIGEGRDAATVTASGGLAGTSSQGRVNPFPGDIDLGETIRVEAHTASAAGAALATSVQNTVRTATVPRPDGTQIIFLGMSVGTWPPGHPRAGQRIRWTAAEVMAGQKEWRDERGGAQTITLAQAFSEPGNAVANSYWRGPIDQHGTYGEITKVLTYEAIDSDTGRRMFATPSIGQGYQTVSFGAPQVHDTNRVALIDALKPQIAQYFSEGNALKAVKRAYTVARMLNDIAALNDLAPLMGSANAHAHQVTEHVSLFTEEVVNPGGVGNRAMTANAASNQAYILQSRVAPVHDGASQVMREGIERAGDVRANAELYQLLESRVLPPLEEIVNGDAEYVRRAGAVLRAHGYLD